MHRHSQGSDNLASDISNQMFMDSTSGRSFVDRTVKGGENKITKLARSGGQTYDDDNYEREDDHVKPHEKILKEMNRKLDLALKDASTRKKVSFAKEVNYRGSDINKTKRCATSRTTKVSKTKVIQINGILKHNGQQFCNNFGGQMGDQQPMFHKFKQKNQRTLSPNNNFNYGRQQPCNDMAGNFQRPIYQPNQPYDAGIQGNISPNLNNKSGKDDHFERLCNLIDRATSEETRIAAELKEKLIRMAGNIKGRIDAWECKFENLIKRVIMAENQVADIMETARKVAEEDRDRCRLAGELNKKANNEKNTLYRIRIVGDDDIDCDKDTEQPEVKQVNPAPYVPHLPFPEVNLIAEARRKVYRRITEALQIIESSPKSERLMQEYQKFREHRDNLRACKRWFETRVGYYGMEKPYPQLDFPYDFFEGYLLDEDEPREDKLNKESLMGAKTSKPVGVDSSSDLKVQPIIKREDRELKLEEEKVEPNELDETIEEPNVDIHEESKLWKYFEDLLSGDSKAKDGEICVREFHIGTSTDANRGNLVCISGMIESGFVEGPSLCEGLVEDDLKVVLEEPIHPVGGTEKSIIENSGSTLAGEMSITGIHAPESVNHKDYYIIRNDRKPAMGESVFEEVEAIKLTNVVGETRFDISLGEETCSSNGKTRGVEMLNEDGLPSNGKTMETGASMKKVVFCNDLRKDPGKSLRPSHKMKEKVNSKCSRVWRVKDSKSTEAWMVKIKSGGKPLASNKRLKCGWDPPAIYFF